MRIATLPLYLVMLAALSLPGMTHAAAALVITQAWVREAPPASRVLAAYMSIKNPGDAAISIDAIVSPDFESAELHRTVINEGMARMLHMKQLDVPANGSVRLEPGGLHLMLFNPVRPLAAGDSITLTLHLSNGTCLVMNTPVVRQDDGKTHQHH